MTYSTPMRVRDTAAGPVWPHCRMSFGFSPSANLMPGSAPSNTRSSRARLAPAQLDDRVLAADRVGAAVQDVGGRQAAGEVAIDVDVGRDRARPRMPGHRADRRPAFVDGVVGDVRVRVDDARRDELAGGVDRPRRRPGSSTFAPTAAILPSRSTIVPFGIVPRVTVRSSRLSGRRRRTAAAPARRAGRPTAAAARMRDRETTSMERCDADSRQPPSQGRTARKRGTVA